MEVVEVVEVGGKVGTSGANALNITGSVNILTNYGIMNGGAGGGGGATTGGGSGGYGISNAGTISTHINRQGYTSNKVNDGGLEVYSIPLYITGKLPQNYQISIDDNTGRYGQLYGKNIT